MRSTLERDYENGRTAGCYDNVYVSEDLEAALKQYPADISAAWLNGYIVGFFSGYDYREVLNPDYSVALNAAIAFAREHGFDDMRDEDK